MRMVKRPDIPWDHHHDECRRRIAYALAADNKDLWDRSPCRSSWKLFGHLAGMPGDSVCSGGVKEGGLWRATAMRALGAPGGTGAQDPNTGRTTPSVTIAATTAPLGGFVACGEWWTANENAFVGSIALLNTWGMED